MTIYCEDCGYKFKVGDKVYELSIGIIDNSNIIQPEESQAQWCEPCELKRIK